MTGIRCVDSASLRGMPSKWAVVFQVCYLACRSISLHTSLPWQGMPRFALLI
jgi:hypothetical protein